MKTCIGCTHVVVFPHIVYSEYTEDCFSISCVLSHFYMNDEAETNEFFRCMMTATNCPDYLLEDKYANHQD
jgi:hypothetical protein